MFTNTRVLQWNHHTNYAVFIFENLLEKEQLDIVLNKTLELTKQDTKKRKTNVQAHMTDFNELNKHPEYMYLRDKIVSLLHTCCVLRSPHWGQISASEYIIKDFWGMQHHKGDYTKIHAHSPNGYSGAFHIRCPGKNYMHFQDVQQKELLKDNCLYLFPANFLHSVDKHQHNLSRVSIGINLLVDIK